MTNPFPGLRPFDASDALLFFGRDEEIAAVAGRLAEWRFLAVLGVSGSGKSSLVRAGLVPLLHQGILPSSVEQWHVATLRPGDGPLNALNQALAAALPIAPAPLIIESTSYSLVEHLRDAIPSKDALLVIVDQFEEIFDYRRQASATNHAAEADLLVSLLLRAVEQSEVPLYVLLTMRSDFLGECSQFRGLPEALNDGHYLIPRMTRVQLEQAIQGPLSASGVEMHPGLSQELLNQCAEEPDNLPVLQHLLGRLFDAWTHSGATGAIAWTHYRQVGLFTGAIEQDAEQAFARCLEHSPDAGRNLELIFQRITESSPGGRAIRTPCLLADLSALTGVDGAKLLQLVRPFLDRNLLVERHTAEGAKLDLCHECLTWKWNRLSGWIQAEADLVRRLEFLAYSAEKQVLLTGSALQEATALAATGRLNGIWTTRYLAAERIPNLVAWAKNSSFREKQTAARLRRQRRTAIVIAGCAVLVAIGLGLLGWYAWKQSQRAESQAADSRSREIAMQARVLQSSDASRWDKEPIIAIAALQASPTSEAVDLAWDALETRIPVLRVFAYTTNFNDAVKIRLDTHQLLVFGFGMSVYDLRTGVGSGLGAQFSPVADLSPDGSIVCSSTGVTVQKPDRTVCRDVSTKRILLELPGDPVPRQVAISSSNLWVATAGGDGTRLYSILGRKLVHQWNQRGHAINFSPDGKWMVAEFDDDVIATRLSSDEIGGTVQGGPLTASCLRGQIIRRTWPSFNELSWQAFVQRHGVRSEDKERSSVCQVSPDGSRLVTAGRIGGAYRLRILDTKTEEILADREIGTTAPGELTLSADGRMGALIRSKKEVIFFPVVRPGRYGYWNSNSDLGGLSFSPGNKYLTAGIGRRDRPDGLALIDLETASLRGILRGAEHVVATQFSSDDQQISVAWSKGLFVTYDLRLRAGRELASWSSKIPTLVDTKYAQVDRRETLASAGGDYVQLLQADTTTIRHSAPNAEPFNLHMYPKADRLVVGIPGGRILFDYQLIPKTIISGCDSAVERTDTDAAETLAFYHCESSSMIVRLADGGQIPNVRVGPWDGISPDGRWIAHTEKQMLQLVDSKSGRIQWDFKGQADLRIARFLKSGNYVLTWGSRKQCLLEVGSGKPVFEDIFPDASAYFDANNDRYVLLAGADLYVRKPGSPSPEPLHLPVRPESIGFSPDFQVLFAKRKNTLYLFEFPSLRALTSLDDHILSELAFSPDHQWLVHLNSDAPFITILNLKTGQRFHLRNTEIDRKVVWSDKFHSFATLTSYVGSAVYKPIDLDPASLRRRLCAVATRDFTPAEVVTYFHGQRHDLECPSLAQRTLEDWLGQARQQQNAGDSVAASELYETARQRQPGQWRAATLALANLYATTNPQEAIQYFEELRTADPKDSEVIGAECGLLFDRLLDAKRSTQILEAYLKLVPSDAGIIADLIETYVGAGRYQDAIDFSSKHSSELNQSNFRSVIPPLRTAAYQALGNREAAARELQQLTTYLSTHEPVFSWSFSGTKQFISKRQAFAFNRNAWLAALTAFENQKREEFLSTLQKLTATLNTPR